MYSGSLMNQKVQSVPMTGLHKYKVSIPFSWTSATLRQPDEHGTVVHAALVMILDHEIHSGDASEKEVIIKK